MTMDVGRRPSDPPPCDVCERKLPAIRSGSIVCHHDGTYTPTTPGHVEAELEAVKRALQSARARRVEVETCARAVVAAWDALCADEAHVARDLAGPIDALRESIPDTDEG